MPPTPSPLVAILMGSRTDWETMKSAADTLADLHIPHDCAVLSAHRTPDRLIEYVTTAESRGTQVFIAGAGGAAHLPGVIASKTLLPVLGVPIESQSLKGLDSLLSIVQMPAGVPVATLAIGKPGAINAALLAAQILASHHPDIRDRFRAWRAAKAETLLRNTDPRTPPA